MDGDFSHKQAVKLRQCLDHINELQKHCSKKEVDISRFVSPFTTTFDLIHAIPGFDGNNPLTAITTVSEIDVDISAFPSSKKSRLMGGLLPQK